MKNLFISLMVKKFLVLSLLLLTFPSMVRSEAYLTLGPNHNFVLGNGGSVNLDIDQPLFGPVSLMPHGSFDSNEGFRDRSGGLDVGYKINSRLSLSVGATYEKYELLSANDPTETHDVHTALRVKLW